MEKVSSVISEALEFPAVHNEPQNIYCSKGNLKLPYKPNYKILEELASDKFIQCSRYHIINYDYIDKIDTVNRYILLKGVKTPIEIGNSFKKKFLKDIL